MKKQLTVLLTIVLVGILGLLSLPIGGVALAVNTLPPEEQTAYASPDVATKSPTTDTGGWTNPTRAYDDNGAGYTNIASNNPSATHTFGTYGFSLTGDTITQVRVRMDAWSIGSSGTVSQNPTANTNGATPWTNPTYGYTSNNQYATAVYADTTSSKAVPTGDGDTSGTIGMTQIRVPTGDGDMLGTWTASTGNKWDCLNEAGWDGTTVSTSDYVTSTTTANDYYMTTFTAFSVPASATITNVTVWIYIRDSSTGFNAMSQYLKVNGTRYSSAQGNNPGTTATWYSYAWTQNPNTSTAWTVDDVNGSGATPLQQFGVTGTDLSPAFRVCAMYIIVDYTYASNYYANVDETTADDTDAMFFSSASGSSYQLFTSSAFSVPAGAQNIRLRITYRGCDKVQTAATNNLRAGIKVNGVLYSTTDSGSNTGITPTTYTYTFTTNPKTTVAWTVAEINGVSGDKLEQWGVATSDSNPVTLVSMVYAEVLYYMPHDQIYGTFGITGSATITKVELGYEAYSSVAEQLDLYTSSNGGSSWNTVHTTSNLGTSDPNSYTYIDVTSDTTWTWTLLNDTNFKYKVVAHWLSGSPTWSIDALVVRVTYTADDEQIRMDVSWDGGSTWSSSKHVQDLTGTETTYWVDVTSDTTWTPTKLSDANFQVRVDAMTVGADPGDVRLDWIPVEVTYSVNVAPTVGTIAISPSTMTPQEQWTNITVPVTDGDTLADVNQVNVTVFYDSAGNDPSAPGTANVQTCAILTWTRGGSPVWFLAPASTTWQINTGGCSNASDTLTTGNWVFSFKVGKVATHSPGSDDWDIYAKATDSISQTGDNYLRDVEMNGYGEITVDTGSISWGTVGPGCSNETSPVVNITYICNGNYAEQVKTSQNWTSASGNVALNTTGNPGTGEFSPKADDDATLVDAVQVLSASYTTFDTGTQTTESGNVENNNHLWLSLGLDIPVDTYSGTIYFGIAQ